MDQDEKILGSKKQGCHKYLKGYEIKNLIESFNVKDEKFIKNFYSAKFDVNFNKQNTLLFFEKKNIFPSIPRKKKYIYITNFDKHRNYVC